MPIELVNTEQNGIEATDVRAKLNELIALINASASADIGPVNVSTGAVGITDVREALNELIALVAAGYSGTEVADISTVGGGTEETDLRIRMSTVIATVNSMLAPAWVPSGAVAYAGFADGQYWRQDIGVCALTDIMDSNLAWGTFDPDSVVPGVGMTTGERNVVGGYSKSGVIHPDIWAMIVANEGCSIVADLAFTKSGAWTGTSTTGYAQIYFYAAEQNYNHQILFGPWEGEGGYHMRAEVGGVTYQAKDDIVPGPFLRVGATLDFATPRALRSYAGSELAASSVDSDPAITDLDFLGIATILMMNAGQTITASASLGSLAIYGPLDQTALDALVA